MPPCALTRVHRDRPDASWALCGRETSRCGASAGNAIMFQNLKTRLDPKGLLTAASSAETTHEKRANPPASPSRKKPANAQNLENATKDVVLQEYYAVQNQLARYQQRLSDVVQAYKTLQKEKQTLENSLHALSSTVPSDTASQSSESNQVENGEEGDSGDVQSLQQRLSTLAAALSTVTKEKAGMPHRIVRRCRMAICSLPNSQCCRHHTLTTRRECSNSTRKLYRYMHRLVYKNRRSEPACTYRRKYICAYT